MKVGPLDVGVKISNTVYIPNDLDPKLNSYVNEMLKQDLDKRYCTEMMGCAYSSLLTAEIKEIHPTQGMVTNKDLVDCYHVFKSKGISAAHCYLDEYDLEPYLDNFFKSMRSKKTHNEIKGDLVIEK